MRADNWTSSLQNQGSEAANPAFGGLRVTAYDVLEYLARVMAQADILPEFPCLTEQDIRSPPSRFLLYSARKLCYSYCKEEE